MAASSRVAGRYGWPPCPVPWRRGLWSSHHSDGSAASKAALSTGHGCDQPERILLGVIREQVLMHTREVPHSVAVTIDRVEEMLAKGAAPALPCCDGAGGRKAKGS